MLYDPEEAQGTEISTISSDTALANDPITSESVAKDTHYVASEDTYLKGFLVLTLFLHCSLRISILTEPWDLFLLSLSDNFGDIHVSQVSADSETLAEVEDNPKKDESVGDMGIDELTSQDPSSSAFTYLAAKGL